jgi:hypothetical protein
MKGVGSQKKGTLRAREDGSMPSMWFQILCKIEHSVIDRLALGVFDGNEIRVNGTSATLFMYGPDSERLFW